jgi:LDH2 family malate/lactate/ureidoglycolate dehydrogenase
MPTYRILPTAAHNELVRQAYLHRGYTAAEADDAARFCEMASVHGIRTHNAIKALHLDHLFGSAVGGCKPGAEIKVIEKKFAASEVWDGQLKLGQSVAFHAMERCMEMADQYGIGQVSVDNAFHYLWGGGYVMDAAKKGYIAYTNCTSTLGEVVPFGGKFPVLGTNPHSWGLPTTEACGFPVVIDWATSTVAMGRVQQLRRENKELPPGAAVDAEGHPTTDPHKAQWLLPFGAHKGYGLSLLIEIMGGLIVRSAPAASTSRSSILTPSAPDSSRKVAASRRTSKQCSRTSSVTAMKTACSPASPKPKMPLTPPRPVVYFSPMPKSKPLMKSLRNAALRSMISLRCQASKSSQFPSPGYVCPAHLRSPCPWRSFAPS